MNSRAKEYDARRRSLSRNTSSNIQMSHQDYNSYETSYTNAYAAQRPTSARYASRTNDHMSQMYGSHGSHSQLQAQQHIFRTAQASKQMVYDVYGNTLTMLEELEHRELKEQGSKSLARSDIHLPSQSAHDKATIQRKLDTQLLLLQSQLQSCDRGILGDVRDDLKVKTIDWASQRQAHQVKRGKTDKYSGKLYEVLATGKTKHPDEFNKKPSLSERDMQTAMGAYMHGNQLRYTLDSSFKHDSNKQAVAPRVRAGAGTELGVERLIEVRPDMENDLRHYSPYDNK